MLKFVEVCESSSFYDPEIQSCRTSFFLREIYLNPRYIVSMKENEGLQAKAKLGALIEGLNLGISFTELVVFSSGSTPRTLNVVGAPGDLTKELL